MPKCKWCRETFSRDELTSKGYCKDCYDSLRQSILEKKARLDELYALSSPDLDAAQKREITEETETIYEDLCQYKQRKVAHFTSDIEGPRQKIYQKLQLSTPAIPSRKSNPVMEFLTGVLIWTVSFSLLCQIIYTSGYWPQKKVSNVVAQSAIDSSVAAPVPAIESKPETKHYSTELCSGHYTVGMDIPSGTYDFTAIKGGGNVISTGNINEIMGVPGKEDIFGMYTERLEDIALVDGEVLSINSVRLGITSKDASAAPLLKRDQEIVTVIVLEPNKTYVSGTDFDPGIYCLEAVSGGGNVFSQDGDRYGVNLIMGTDDQNTVDFPDFYEQQFNNVSLPDRTILYLGDVSIRLTPSK